MFAASTDKIKRKEILYGIGFILPSILGCLVFVLIPFASAIYRSFTNNLTGSFEGFRYYQEIFRNPSFLLACQNTIRFIAWCVPILILLSLWLAMLLFRPIMGRNILRAAFLLPMAIPVASVALLWQVLFHANGIINTIMQSFGWNGIDWMRSDAAMFCLVLSYVWKNLGYTMVMFLAALSNIAPSLYEAADMDGASSFAKLRFITLPSLSPMLFTVTVLSLLNSFKAYREAYLVAGKYPHNSIYLIQHTLNNWFAMLDMEKLSAAAVVTAVVILALVMLLNRAWSTNTND